MDSCRVDRLTASAPGRLAITFGTAAVVAALAVSDAAMRALPSLATLLAWPHGFHLALLSAAFAGLSVICAGLHHHRERLLLLWALMPARRRAGALLAGLLLAEAALLLAAWFTGGMGPERAGGLRAALYLGGEGRLPGLFAAGQLALAGWLAWRVHRHTRRGAWRLAAAACAYMAADELLGLHEAVGRIAAQAAGLAGARVTLAEGWAVHTWQLVFAPVALVVGLRLLQQFRASLDRASLLWLVLAAGVFLAGALGVETAQASGAAADAGWHRSALGRALLILEEGLEMLGVSLAVYVFAREAWSHREGEDRAFTRSWPVRRERSPRRRACGTGAGRTRPRRP